MPWSPDATHPEAGLARRIRELSEEQWGGKRSVLLIGRHPSVLGALEKVVRFAQADAPVLITGETGTGKDLFARAIYLLSTRRRKPFVAVNCAQYAEGQLIASELFGHRRGSFTGAVADHRGVLEEANGGVAFLDEVGELSAPAQAMLLRALSEGEIVPVGDTRARSVDVRIIAATNRDLRARVSAGAFREDLLYRLRFLQLNVAPLRERGHDWRLLLDHYLGRLNRVEGSNKQFSPRALARLEAYAWPGNVRELRGLVDTAFYLADGAEAIEPDVFEDLLSTPAAPANGLEGGAALAADACDRLQAMMKGETSFWTAVYEPFMARELNRAEVKLIVSEALRRSNWSYKRALALFGVDDADYLKLMDFLRHHRLKPGP